MTKIKFYTNSICEGLWYIPTRELKDSVSWWLTVPGRWAKIQVSGRWFFVRTEGDFVDSWCE